MKILKEKNQILNPIRKYCSNGVKVILTSLIAALACTGIIYAATTVGTNISTGGTLDVTGASTFTTASSTGIVRFANINSDTGAISFDNENLTTTGTLTITGLTTLGNASTTLLSISNTAYIGGDNGLTLTGGSITDATGAISFGNEDLTTTGDLSVANATTTGAFNVDGNTVLATTTLSGDLGVTGDLTLSGGSAKLSSPNAQWSYMKAGAYLSNMTQCKLMIMWQNPADGGTETDLCGSNTITYDADADFTSSDRVTKGLSWVLDFSTPTKRVTVSEDDSIAFGDGTNSYDFTIFFWFQAPSTGSIKMLLHKNSASGEELDITYTLAQGVNIYAYDDSAAVSASSQTPSSYFVEDTWYFYTVTHNESVGSGTTFNDGTKIYVNGVDITSTDVTQNCTTAAPCAGFVAIEDIVGSPLYIGASYLNGNKFNKRLGDVGITREVLTPAQIKAIYQASRGFM